MTLIEWQKQQLDKRIAEQAQGYLKHQLVGKTVMELAAEEKERLNKSLDGIINANVEWFLDGRRELGTKRKKR